MKLIDKYQPKLDLYDVSALHPIEHRKLLNSTVDNHFLVWSDNPIKICVLIVYILKKLTRHHEELLCDKVVDKYCEIANQIINC
jgi:hypothetical protein